MRGKKAIAWALSAIMALAPLSACAPQGAPQGEAAGQAGAEEEMSRALDVPGEFITVEKNDDDTYTVTITEENLVPDEALAEEMPEVVTAEEAAAAEEMPEVEAAEEEMARDGDAIEAEPEGDPEAVVAEEGSADEDVVVADDGAAEPKAEGDAEAVEAEPEKAEEAEPEEAEDAEPGEWSIREVKREDIQVVYKAMERPGEEGAEPEMATYVGEILDFQNDGGAIKLRFRGGAPGSECTYTVRFGDNEPYAVVSVVPPAADGVDIPEVDYEAQEAEVAGAGELGFTAEDVVLPEGTYADEEGDLVVTDEAPEAVQDTLVDLGIAEDEMARVNGDGDEMVGDGDDEGGSMWGEEEDDDEVVEFAEGSGSGSGGSGSGGSGSGGSGSGGSGSGGDEMVDDVDDEMASGFDENGGSGSGSSGSSSGSSSSSSSANTTSNATLEYIKQYNAKQKQWKNYDAVADYAPEVLGYIDPTAGKVAEFGSNAYRIFRAFATNDWESGIKGTLGVLKMFGLFKSKGAAGVSNADLLSEIQKVGLEVSDMHSLTKEMNKTANVTLSEVYKLRIQDFDLAMTALNANAEIAQRMYTSAAMLADARGIPVPGEDATAEEEYEFNYQLKKLIEEQERSDSRAAQQFKGFTKAMEAVRDNYTLVAGAVGQPDDTNVVKAYDSLWDMYFNWETQGYYLRQSYRSDIDYELTRAFGLIEMYYNIFDPQSGSTNLPLADLYLGAMEQLESMDPGMSPEGLVSYDLWGYPNRYLKKPVRCNTFDRRVKGMEILTTASGNNVATGVLEEYIRRLHGRTIDEDMRIAGVWLEKDYLGNYYKWTPDYQKSEYSFSGHGLGFNCKKDGDWYKADYITYFGTLQKGQKSKHKDRKKMIEEFDNKPNWEWSIPYVFFYFE